MTDEIPQTEYPNNLFQKSSEKREGISADCKLPPTIVVAILMGGREHPCDRCNHDRSVCRGFARK